MTAFENRLTRRALLGSAAALSAQERITGLELFLLIGQSNMVGLAKPEPADREPIEGVFSLRDGRWSPAVDPLHSAPKLAGAGLGRSFARTLLRARPAARIGLIPAAVGATGLDEWAPGGKLYSDALALAKIAQASGRLRGILWHQGEKDSRSEETARSYGERWLTFSAKLRQDFADVPIVVGQLGPFLAQRKAGEYPWHEQVNRALALLPVQASRVAFVSSSGLTDGGDHLHFNAPSLREFGRRYAHAFMGLDAGWETGA